MVAIPAVSAAQAWQQLREKNNVLKIFTVISDQSEIYICNRIQCNTETIQINNNNIIHFFVCSNLFYTI